MNHKSKAINLPDSEELAVEIAAYIESKYTVEIHDTGYGEMRVGFENEDGEILPFDCFDIKIRMSYA